MLYSEKHKTHFTNLNSHDECYFYVVNSIYGNHLHIDSRVTTDFHIHTAM